MLRISMARKSQPLALWLAIPHCCMTCPPNPIQQRAPHIAGGKKLHSVALPATVTSSSAVRKSGMDTYPSNIPVDAEPQASIQSPTLNLTPLL